MGTWMRRFTLPLAVLGMLLVVAATIPAGQDATITLGTDPEPPECAYPGDIVTIFWSVDFSTTPDFVYYCLYDPDLEIVEEQLYDGASGIAIEREWIVPADAPDGQYWVHVEFWSEEVGHEAEANVCFLVCADTPVDPATWGAIKGLFR